MLCPVCNKEVDDNVDVCPVCGCPLANARAKQDSGSYGWWLLGFFFPLVGLILWLVWRENTPLRAKRAGWGALIGVITVVALVILFLLSVFLFGMLVGFLS